MARNDWKEIIFARLTGAFDARNRPADLASGDFRWKQNFAVSDTGKLLRRDGHRKLFSQYAYDSETGDLCADAATSGCEYVNADLHNQGSSVTREAINLIYSNANPDSTTTLFAACPTRVYRYSRATGDWTKLDGGPYSALGAWKAAGLAEDVIFTNNVDEPQILQNKISTTTLTHVLELKTGDISMSRARVVASFMSFVLLMNTTEGGTVFSSRVRWCHLNDATKWLTGTQAGEEEARTSGFQDLDYGDDILGAAPLGGSLLIYTKRAIWRCYLQTADAAGLVFGFQKLYSEPKNSTNCLAYPNTLVSTGDAHYYMSRDGICKWTQYSTQPEQVGWIHASSALIYDSMYPTYRIDSEHCESPVAEYRPKEREIWFSWPSTDSAGVNNHSLVCNVKWQTCDYVDTGYSAIANHNESSTCPSEAATLIGASTVDYCLKEMAPKQWYREYAALIGSDVTRNIESPSYSLEGYNSILRGEMPLEYPDRKKAVRKVILDHQTNDEGACFVRLKIGESYHIADANLSTGNDAVSWRVEENKVLESPDAETAEDYEDAGLTPEEDFLWPVWRKARHLYYDFEINGGAVPATGGDSAWTRIIFDSKIVP